MTSHSTGSKFYPRFDSPLLQVVLQWIHMPERERRPFPSWAERERASDLASTSENLHVFRPVAQQAYEEHGRGAGVVDTTQWPTGERRPFGYFPQALVEQTGDEDTQRMVRQYDPSWEVVTVLLKTHDQTSAYRVEVISGKLRQ